MNRRTTNGVVLSRPRPTSHILVCVTLEQGAETWEAFSS